MATDNGNSGGFAAVAAGLGNIGSSKIGTTTTDTSEEEEESSNDDTTQMFVTYSSEERSRLRERFDRTSSVTTLVSEGVASMAESVATTTMKVAYNFKKVRYLTFKDENLSSFTEEESEQGVTVATTTTTGTTTMDGSGY